MELWSRLAPTNLNCAERSIAPLSKLHSFLRLPLLLPAEAALTPALSGNVQYQSYHDGSGIFSRWAMPVWSYLHACADGMERVEYIPGSSGARLVVEQYTMDGAIARLAPANPFKDVADGAYYYEPVLWVVNHVPQITNGTGGDTFSPGAYCTRGQIVTFLHRDLAG